MEKENLEKIFCTECAEYKSDKEFYKRFVSSSNSYGTKIRNNAFEEFERVHGICKECLIKEFQASLENFKGDVKEAIKYICSKYDLPYDENLICKERGMSKTGELKNYIRKISSLKQYEYKGFVEHYHKPENKIDNMSFEDVIVSRDDIEFLNRDIEGIKKQIGESLLKHDVNSHGKWMNSLRDAIRLKEDIEMRSKISTNKWELKYSNYKTDDNIPMVSVWEQNDNGEIRNTKQFRLYDEKLLKMIVKLLNQIDMEKSMPTDGYYRDLINYLQLENIKNQMNKLVYDDKGNPLLTMNIK